MLRIKLCLWIYHFRLYPDSKQKSLRFHFVDQLIDSIRELLFIYIPVAKAVINSVTLAKPSIIYYEQLRTQLFCLSCKLFLLLNRYIKTGCFPGIIKYRTKSFPK